MSAAAAGWRCRRSRLPTGPAGNSSAAEPGALYVAESLPSSFLFRAGFVPSMPWFRSLVFFSTRFRLVPAACALSWGFSPICVPPSSAALRAAVGWEPPVGPSGSRCPWQAGTGPGPRSQGRKGCGGAGPALLLAQETALSGCLRPKLPSAAFVLLRLGGCEVVGGGELQKETKTNSFFFFFSSRV